ncbi:MAG: S66 peptidase family protein [Flavitalea sp.]
MNRKRFIRSASALFASLPFGWRQLQPSSDEIEEQKFIIPGYLKRGDTIGITSPAGYITVEEITPAVRQMEGWGFKLKIGESIGKRLYTFGGTDDERKKDFQAMLDNPAIKAIICARGGYGVVRIIDQLNFEKFKLKPKWIIGFSDLTVLHSHLSHNYKIASLHSKMCNSFPEDWSKAEPVQVETIHSIRRALTGEKLQYFIPPHEKNKLGVTEGILVGGNLKTLESLSGSKSDISTTGKILFVEDTGEYLYSIDRMFWNLKRTGKLSGLKGLIVGGFKVKPDDPGEEFALSVQDIVLEKVKGYKFPVCFDFPVGHQKNNFALKCGIMHLLKVERNEVVLREVV